MELFCLAKCVILTVTSKKITKLSATEKAVKCYYTSELRDEQSKSALCLMKSQRSQLLRRRVKTGGADVEA
jgi:hypothetical protein